MRWISWVAVSSKPQQERESPKAQRRDNLAVIEKLGGTLVAELEVPGESRSLPSFEVAEREIEAYAQLRQLLNERAADAIVFLDVSRLGRTAPLAMSVMHECLNAGVALYDRSSPPPTMSAAEQRQDEGQLVMSSIRASYAAIEVQRLTKRHRTGMLARVRSGKMPGQLPYGYRRIYDRDGTERVIINEDEAEIVRHIFRETLAGKSRRQIARELNEARVPTATPSATGWHPGFIYQVVRKGRTYAGFVGYRDRELGQVYYDGNHEAIVSLATVQQVERELAESGGKARGNRVLLYTGVLICDKCGETMWSKHNTRARYWECRSRKEVFPGVDGEPCEGAFIAERRIDNALAAFVRWARNGVNLRQIVENVPMESTGQLRKIDDLEADILGLNQERERLIYMGQKGILSVDEIGDRIARIDTDVATLRTVVRELSANIPYETLEIRRERLYEFMRTSDDIFDKLPTTEANAILRRTLRMFIRNGKVDRIETI